VSWCCERAEDVGIAELPLEGQAMMLTYDFGDDWALQLEIFDLTCENSRETGTSQSKEVRVRKSMFRFHVAALKGGRLCRFPSSGYPWRS
jgi:hypothetical protein